MNENIFARSDFILCVGTAQEFCSAVYTLQHEKSPTTIVRLLRGKNMTSTTALFNEFAAALQFPCYFGNNWNAFDECIADLEWLAGEAYIIAIVDAPSVLRDQSAELDVFARIVRSVTKEWRDRDGFVFQVVLHCTAEEIDAVQQTFGASIDIIRANELRTFARFLC